MKTPAPPMATRSSYRLLCQVDDDVQRTTLLTQTLKNGWTSPELQERVRTFNATVADSAASSGVEPGAFKPKLLTAKHGTPGLYPVVARREALAVDLGFKQFRPLTKEEVRALKLAAGSIVRVDAAGNFSRADDATKADLFTYRTLQHRIVDGDTLAVTLALTPHHEIDKKLRLRGVNCPEMDTAAGKAAKRFVQNLVEGATSLVLTTTKPDKYDRYLADVFGGPSDGPEIFLNNALLENDHATRMDAAAPIELL